MDNYQEDKKPKTLGGKLFKLREWLTVPEAARYLSHVLYEEVNEADLLRLALDGHLKLSVYFVNYTNARCGKIFSYEDVNWRKPFLPTDGIEGLEGKDLLIPDGLDVGNDRWLKLDHEVVTIKGVWDLPMIGSERLDIEDQYQQVTGGPEVTLTCLDGAFIEGADGVICQLQERFDNNELKLDVSKKTALKRIKEFIATENIDKARAKEIVAKYMKSYEEHLKVPKKWKHEDYFYPAGGLPSDSVLVVRTQALSELTQSLFVEKSEEETPLTGSERQELGMLRQQKAKWEASIKAAIDAALSVRNGKKIKRRELKDKLFHYNLPDTTLEIIWKGLRDKKLTKGPGRPSGKAEENP